LGTKHYSSLFPKLLTLIYNFQGQHRSNPKTDLNSQHMVSYLLPIQYGHLSPTVWPQHAIYHCALCPKTDDLELWASRSTEVKSKKGFELAAYGFLFAPYTIWAIISDRLATKHHLSLFPKLLTLIYNFQGQHRSSLQTDLNSQLMVSYLLPIQYGHLSLTVWPQHAIYHSALCPKTDELEL